MDVQRNIASSSEPEQTHSGEDREKQDLHNGATQEENISLKKRIHLGNDSGSSVESSKKRKVPLNEKQSAGNYKDKAGPSADANARSDQSSSEIDLSSDSSDESNESDESQSVTNENDRHRKPTTSTQDVLDGTSDPAPKMKISNIVIDISYGNAYFQTSDGKDYPERPLRNYMSILRESEADAPCCLAHIVFRAPFFGGYWVEAEFRKQSVLRSQGKFKQFSEDVHSISRLWENGRILVELLQYTDVASAYISMYGFCEALFGKDRSILKCKAMFISWFNNWWPFSVITNVVNHCNELIFIINQHPKQKLHNTFLDILYKAELPRHVEISVELDRSGYEYDIIQKLKERFKDSNAQYFKFKLVSFGLGNMLISTNDHATLEMKLVDSHHEHNSRRRRDTVIIEQKPHLSVPDQQSA